MKNILRKLALLLIIFICHQTVSLFASDKTADEIIKKVKDKYHDLKTFYAEFSQTSYWKLADNVHEQKGKIWLKDTDKFRIETEDQTVVSDGKTIWTYSQFNNQVIIDKAEKSGEEIRLPKDIFFKYSENYNQLYLREAKIEDQPCHVLELRAKTEDIFVKYMKIWINVKVFIPIKIEQIDINDNSNSYLLKNIQMNETITDNLFIYKVPDSVEVIDMR